MKYFYTLLAAALVTLLMSVSAQADQRFESATGLCHFAYDENDDDNEVYLANCQNSIKTHDAGDGEGRLAYGTSSLILYKYAREEAISPLDGKRYVRLRGRDADPEKYSVLYTEAPNIPCVMVTSNYDANNDDNNQTVYVTDDWNLIIRGSTRGTIKYYLSCRRGVRQ